MHTQWPWVTLALLGAYHGLNPGMGWLFAVSLGLQRRSRRAVYAALPPIALGHAASIAVVAGAVFLAETFFARQNIPFDVLKWVLAALLIGFGVFKLFRTRHPRWVGMQVGFKDLTLWSFLMASAHGAGLMLVPVLLALSHRAVPAVAARPAIPSPAMATMASMPANCPMLTAAPPVPVATAHIPVNPWPSVGAVGLHTLSMLLVAGIIAVIVYEKLGLSLLRRAWFNLDYLWSIALVIAGIVAALL